MITTSASSVESKSPLSGSSPLPIAIFVATRWELQAVRRALPTDSVATIGGVHCLIAQRRDRAYWLIQTGVGPDAAAMVANAVLNQQRMALVLSTGFACALVPAAVGDLIVGTEVCAVRDDGAWTMCQELVRCDPTMQARLIKLAQGANLTTRTGRIVSAPTVAWQASDKQTLQQLTQATALDMESAALAAEAKKRDVPVAIVRTVSDLIDEDLPLDFNLFLRPTGWMQGMRALACHPGSLVGLNRLRKQSRVAADRLTDWFQHFADADFEGVRFSGE